MKITVSVCDCCGDPDDKVLLNLDGHEFCGMCFKLFQKAKEIARQDLQAKVDFSVANREAIVEILSKPYIDKVFNDEKGKEVKQELLTTLNRNGK